MSDFTTVGLWTRSFAKRDPDADEESRERLRSTLLRLRERAKFLAGEIARDLPEFTNHDVTHLDALWELADLICGPEYKINPIEAFVLGGAFLVHDLGMGLAAYPDGIKSLKNESLWRDTVAASLREKLHRVPTSEEVNTPDPETEEKAKVETLRFLHASRAEHLGLTSWQGEKGGETYHLIEDADIRATYGKLIGRIAHSHWWPVSKLKQEFPETIGAPSFGPSQWTVNPLKLASILRVADASHLDERRATGFARAVRKPSSSSRAHWVFQEYLQKPQLKDGRLVFTALRPFPIDESEAWWLCFEILREVDRELQRTDALLADEGIERFAAKGVAGIEDPLRLRGWIATDGWLPVNAQVRVSNVAKLVRTLGGEALYGPNPTVPLRELIQNASDAVRARRILDAQSTWGSILVRMGQDDEGYWIEVEDSGVGMSEDVLCNTLLDFGNPYWGSTRMIRDFPGLLSKGFIATGTYGIGFFSVFMWGEHVRITTRRFEDARRETRVLEITGGPESRALLRPAAPEEFLKDGGSRIRVWLTRDPNEPGGILKAGHNRAACSLADLCQWIAPAIDVDVFASRETEKSAKVISASDWIELPAENLLRRTLILCSDSQNTEIQKLVTSSSANVRPLRNSDNEIVGRACIVTFRMLPDYFPFQEPGGFSSAVTVGGLRSSAAFRFFGILTGSATNAARNAAIPIVEEAELQRWATEQATLASRLTQDPRDLMEFASIVAQCGGETGDLPIAYFRGKPLSRSQIASLRDLPDTLLLLSHERFFSLVGDVPSFVPIDNLLVIFENWFAVLESLEWPHGDIDTKFHKQLLAGQVLSAVGEAWGLTPGWLSQTYREALDKSSDQRQVGSASGAPILADTYLLKRPLEQIILH